MDDKSDFTNFSMGWGLPVAQAFISGLIVFILVLAGAILLKAERPSAWALGAGALVAAFSWFTSIGAWHKFVYSFEDFTHSDITGDGIVGDPVKIELYQGNSIRLFDLPIDEDRLIKVAEGLVDGLSLSEATWTGANGVLSRSEFTALRSELIRRGLAAWNSPRSPARGASLTLAGRGVLRQYASMSYSPSPTLQRSTPKDD